MSLPIVIQAVALLCAIAGAATDIERHPWRKVNFWTFAYTLLNVANILRA